ncbi:MAG: S9 family peptidase [Bacteroidetes bacterium]|nr:S9 family peptidase [Bacteroidota bacterium]
MKYNYLIYVIAGLLIISACQNKKQSTLNNGGQMIGPKEMKLGNDIMTPEVLWSFGRLGDVSVSPDEKKVLYSVTYFDISQNKSNRELFIMNIDGSNKKQLTHTQTNESGAVWTPNGKKIAFMSSESGTNQLWEMNLDGDDRKMISNVNDGITGFLYAPDSKKILYTKEVKAGKTVKDLYPDLDKCGAKIIDDLMYRHWDQWVESFSHIFIADFDGSSLKNDKDIMQGEPWESPVRPFGGTEQLTWSPDSKSIAYTSRKKEGKAYALSTNTDIYLYDLASGKTANISETNKGYDVNPVFSPDGKKIAWSSMERDGYEADKRRLMVYDVATQKQNDFTTKFDQDVEGLIWTADGKSIYFISDIQATDEVFKLDLGTTQISRVTNGIHNYTSVIPTKSGILICTRVSMSKPAEIYAVNSVNGIDKQISDVNNNILGQLKMGKVEKRWVKTTDNKQMLTWVIYPPHFDSTKRYPTILYCEGGPQSTVSQFWSFRWNFQMMAANGYIVVAPNRRGLPGFGKEWNEQISGDYGGQNMKDYLSAIDALSKEPYVNKDKLGCVGASYGGFSVYWLAGHHNKRFKAFIAHDGMYNLEAQYDQTEEMWFANWDLGGPYWDKNNKKAQNTYANSPHKFVQNWDTPILVIHGEQDFRIPVTQGMSAFNAAKLRGVPARFLYFPDENHWVLKPQNGILWQRVFKDWLDKYLK